MQLNIKLKPWFTVNYKVTELQTKVLEAVYHKNSTISRFTTYAASVQCSGSSRLLGLRHTICMYINMHAQKNINIRVPLQPVYLIPIHLCIWYHKSFLTASTCRVVAVTPVEPTCECMYVCHISIYVCINIWMYLCKLCNPAGRSLLPLLGQPASATTPASAPEPSSRSNARWAVM